MSGSPRSRITASGGARASASRARAAVGGGLDLVALEPERALERGTHCGIVVDHQDLHSCAAFDRASRSASVRGERSGAEIGEALFWLVGKLTGGV